MDWKLDNLSCKIFKLGVFNFNEVEITMKNTQTGEIVIQRMHEERFLKALFGKRVWFRG
jgi:hypothetical protein